MITDINFENSSSPKPYAQQRCAYIDLTIDCYQPRSSGRPLVTQIICL